MPSKVSILKKGESANLDFLAPINRGGTPLFQLIIISFRKILTPPLVVILHRYRHPLHNTVFVSSNSHNTNFLSCP